MKLLALFFLITCSSVPTTAQTPVWTEEQEKRPKLNLTPDRTRPEFVLVDGTPVKLKLKRELSSATEQVGATVDFEVLEPVILQEKVVITQGAIALGTVIEAEPKRRMGRTGKLTVRIDTVVLADGQRAPLRAVNAGADGSRVTTVAATTTAVGIVFFPAAPLFLLMKGKDIVIPNGTFVTAYINSDQKLDQEKFSIPAEKPVASIQLKVEKAEMEGAEIWIGEKFVGNTPATIKLPEGEYKVIVQKNGYQPWQRTLAVSAGSLMNLTIKLEKTADTVPRQ